MRFSQLKKLYIVARLYQVSYALNVVRLLDATASWKALREFCL